MKIRAWLNLDEQMCNLGRHHWSVSRLITLARDLPRMDIPLNHLHLYYQYKSLSLRDMVMHFNAVNDADLKTPIILDEDGEVMDGRHRIMKAMMLGEKTIKAVRFEFNPEPCKVSE